MKRTFRVAVYVVVDDDSPDDPENEENILVAAQEVAAEMIHQDPSNVDIEEMI